VTRAALAVPAIRRLLGHGAAGETAWALLDQGATLAASTLSFLLLGRILGAAGYGAYAGLYSLIAPFTALTQSGVFLTTMEHVVRDREAPVDVARSCLSLTALNALLWVPILSAVGLRWIEGLPVLATVLLIGAEFALNGTLLTSVGMVQAVVGYPAAARLRIAGSLSRIVLLGVLAAAGSLTLTTLAVGQVLTLGAVSALSLASVARRLGTPIMPGRVWPAHVRSALLYGIGIGASMAQSDGDRFVLNAARHQADAGRYGAAYRLMQIMLLPINALAGATHVSFLDRAAGAGRQIRRALRLSLVALAYALPAISCLMLLAPLVPRILGRDFAQTTLILRLLAPVVVLRGVGVFPMNGLMGLGRNALRTKLLAGNALLSLALYAAWIPKYSWQGALAATVVSEFSLCACGWVALAACERNLRRAPGPEPVGSEAPVPITLHDPTEAAAVSAAGSTFRRAGEAR
jgi:O-antigen/teichoic acid export membrane protein